MAVGTYLTTEPDHTEKSAGSAVNEPKSISESGLSHSGTEFLLKIFPLTPYENGYNRAQCVAIAKNLLHPEEQASVLGWGPDTKVWLDYSGKLASTGPAPDQTNLGNDLVPADGYAPFPNPNDHSVQPSTPPGYDANQPTQDLEKPSITGPLMFKTLGAALGLGVDVHQT